MLDEGKMDAAKQAATAFVDTIGPKDAAAVIAFSTDVRIVQGYTADKVALKNAINGLAAKGDTDLYGAVTQSAQLIGALPQAQRAMLLISDGEDTVKKQTLDGSIQAAKSAKTAVYTFGLGKDAQGGPLKDALVKLAVGTGGQSAFVANSGDLKNTFAKQAERFRRRYVLTYTSQLLGDDKPHNLTVKAKRGDQDGEGTSQFTAKRLPMDFDVVGLADVTKVGGTIRVQIAVKSGTPQQVELLVDDKSRGTAGAPFALQWDTSAEPPGMHRVIVRVKDASGATTDRAFVVSVDAPATAVPSATVAPSATPAPTIAPTAVPTVAPTVAPVAASAGAGNTLSYAIAGVLGLGLIGGLAFLLLRRRGKGPQPLPAPEPARPADCAKPTPPPTPVGESAVLPAIETSIASAQPALPQPRARLHVAHYGAQWEFLAEKPEVNLGREATNDIVIRDPLASRRHARLVTEGGEFWLEDLKSMSGTRINGEVVAKHKLATGDQVGIGDAVIVYSALPEQVV